MRETIFFVEDDLSINALIKAALELNGYRAIDFTHPSDFLRDIGTLDLPDLIVLDLMLPGISGYDVIAKLKSEERYAGIPVIVLSALSDEPDVVKGLDLGAADYIRKPFGVREFISRVKSNLRKAKEKREEQIIHIRELRLDKDAHTCFLCGKPVALTDSEFKLLSVLMKNAPKVMDRHALLREIWDFADGIETRTVDMHIKSIREKFSLITQDEYIVTVRAAGYGIKV